MKMMNCFRRKHAGICIVLSMLILGQGIVPFSVYSDYVVEEVWVDGHEDTEWVDGYFDGTNWVEGYEYTYWVPGNFTNKLVWVPDEDGDDDGDGSSTEPIDTRTGSNYFTERRLHVPCPGLPLELNLKYQSISSMPVGMLGQGWRHNYESALNAATNKATVFLGSGYHIAFNSDTNGVFQTPEGSQWELETVAGGYELSMPGGKSYHYDSSGGLAAVEDAWGNNLSFSYGTNGCLENVAHSNGRQMVFSNRWDSALGEWRVASIRVAGGASLEFDYNSDGQFTQVVEQVGQNCYTSSYHYADGFLTNKVNGAGFAYAFDYETGADGKLNGKGTHLEVAGYYPHDVTYLADNATDVVYDMRGTEAHYRYSRSRGRLDVRYGPGRHIGEALGRGIRYAYSTNRVDKVGETLFDNGTGATWSKWMEYDGSHNMTNLSVSYCTTNPVFRLALDYDPVWQLPSGISDSGGKLTETIYTNGSVRAIRACISPTNSYDTYIAYTTNGLVHAATNANGHVVVFGYDPAGNRIAQTPEAGPQVTNSYNHLGFMTAFEILPEAGASSGRRYVLEPDAHGRTTAVTYPDGLAEEYRYNALGYLVGSVDRAGRATDYTYAPSRKLTSVTRYLKEGGTNAPVRIGFDLDEQCNVLRISEPRNRFVESYQLDIQDRVVAATNIENQVMVLGYTVGDFIDTVTRFDGSMVSNAYDVAGRLSSRSYAGTDPVVFDYYTDGDLKMVADAAGSVSNGYDRLNRLTHSRIRPTDANAPSQTADNTYDPVGNRTRSSILAADADGWPWHLIDTDYTYDSAERLKTCGGHTYTYNPENGRVASISNTVSGITCIYTYDLLDRATNIVYTLGTNLIRSLDYEYDDVGMVTKKRISNNEQGTGNVEVDYTYDSLDRLVHESTSTNGHSLFDIHYSYDLAGNRLSKNVDGLETTYTLGTGNRLASSTTATNATLFVSGTADEPIGTDPRWGDLYITNLTSGSSAVPGVNGKKFYAGVPSMPAATNTLVAAIRDVAGNMGHATNEVFVGAATGGAQASATYDYDAAGCLTNLNGVSLEWDERYRLVEVDDASSFVQYEYDVLGRRAARIENGTTNFFVYDGQQVVADLDAGKNLLRTYSYGSGIDNILTMTTYSGNQPVATYTYIKDHQNTVIALADETGTVVESYAYSAYGETKVFNASGVELAESALGNRYCFQGREIDWRTGLIYFRARWYDPDTGRWLSKDQIGIAGGLNLYEFCRSNPVGFVDPFGLDGYSATEPDVGTAAAGFVVGAILGSISPLPIITVPAYGLAFTFLFIKIGHLMDILRDDGDGGSDDDNGGGDCHDDGDEICPKCGEPFNGAIHVHAPRLYE